MDSEQIQTFMGITGASEAVARDKLQTHGGDLNAAINSYFNEGENPNPLQNQDTGRLDLMEEDEPPPRPFVPPSAPAWTSDSVGLQGFGTGLMAPRFPRHGASIVSQPRDVREVPIDWKDEEPRVRSRGGVFIEEVPDSTNAQLPSQNHSHFVVDDDDEVEAPTSSTLFRSSGDRPANTGFNAPSISEIPTGQNTEGDDIEEEMMRAAIEASQKEARTFGGGGSGIHEDDDLARAVSLSLKTAEQEKAMREGKSHSSHNEESYMKGSTSQGNYCGDSGSLPHNPLPVNNPSGLDTSVNPVNRSSMNSLEETEDLEEPLLRRRSGRRMNPSLTAPSEPLSFVGQGSPPLERNGDVTHDEWGGLSTEEHDEAVMLEAAMFGSLPEDSSLRYRYPSVVGGVSDATDSNDLQSLSFRRPAQPPSPTVIAQRLLREQQDDEYLASLQADREKELRAQEAADAEEKLRREEQQRKQEEERLKKLAEEELERQLAAKRAALPDEPSVEDENAVNLMVRMPDGSRKCRRFRKSELLQCLFDFIDISGGTLPGSYRLVRQYPRKAFADADHGCSLNDLGLNNKYETLFLELI